MFGFDLFGPKRELTGVIDTTKNSYTISDGCTSYISSSVTARAYYNLIKNPHSVKTTGSL